ncbi:MAG: iron-sulfur cluster assembly scaffold protein [Acidobacteriota bacterium]
MTLTLTISGRRCDLSLHPVSSKTVERIQELGRKFYTKKYIHWWRNGNTSTCGMKFDDECSVRVNLGGENLPFDSSAIPKSAVLLRRRHYLESKARYLALLGYDDEYCHMTWTWTNVTEYDPSRFDFFVHRWDRILGEEDFLILDDVRYADAFADDQDWGGSCGFNLVDPRIIDLDEVRRELGIEAPPANAPKAPRAPGKAAAPVMTAQAAPVAEPAQAEAPCDDVQQPAPPCDNGIAELVIGVENPNASGMHGCTTCKNSIRVDLRIEDDVVVQAGGWAAGCDYSKQCLTALASMLPGMTVYDCYTLSNEDLHPLLKKVIRKLDCDTFTVGALKLALRDWEKRSAA